MRLFARPRISVLPGEYLESDLNGLLGIDDIVFNLDNRDENGSYRYQALHFDGRSGDTAVILANGAPQYIWDSIDKHI